MTDQRILRFSVKEWAIGKGVMTQSMEDSDWLEIRFVGPIPSKKNLYKRSKSTHGRKGMYKDEAVVAILQAADSQIPHYARGLSLVNPDMEWEFQIPDYRGDRDNWKTCILDCLVNQGVLRDDSIKYLNGHEHTYPAKLVRHEPMVTIVRLKPGKEVV